ncbi:MAG: hypothetical protein BGO99_02680 [Nitrosospira sp. 56-18]|nr:MAG: hypothetical protein BGO99_02680 [Nitrosospira sp. 56-18]
MIMTDLKHFGNRRGIPWASIIKFVVIALALIWMGERDRQHVIEKNALTDVVHTQARIIDTMPCAGLEMSIPIGRVES